MVNMLENIRRIGIFMIAAQTVMHFAAGKQYEKYMKIISGVIVLLLFIAPFVSSTEDIAAKWQEEVEKMTEQTARINSMWQSEEYTVNYAQTAALRQIEREVKTRLNEMIADWEYYVEDISIELEETDQNAGFWTKEGEYGREFQCVRITLRKQMSGEDGMQNQDVANKIQSIQIEEIEIGETKTPDAEHEEERDSAYDMEIEEYRHFFAQTLGIAEDRVEVSYYGEQ
ncbi:MAG: stage III sporulation protein AF [Lachnospiraceae bacterium]|nr:stage III sporulation protein AF [Lachnospiraceae bacterium]